MTRDIHLSLYQALTKTEQDSLNWDVAALDAPKGTQHLMFLNAHGVNMAKDNADFRRAILASDYLLRDGIGLALAFRALNLSETDNLNGTDLIPKVLARHKTRKIAVWGSSEEALATLGAQLQGNGYTDLVSMEHGFHEDSFYIEAFARLRPEIVVLCMGMPRQEVLAEKLGLPGHDCLIICGGGWANFQSGHSKRAPKLVQQLNIEWLFRLCLEPKRLGRRYTIDILRYFVTVTRISRATK